VQALILVGGEGTRLRPLTTVAPKPVVQLVDRPFMAYMLEWLRRHGVDRVVMSCGYKPDGIRAVLGDGERYGVALTYVEEPTPMGTGGALKFCEEHLEEEFLMLNGDVLTDIDVSAQLARHRETGARGTLGLYPVEDPSAYGLVRLHPSGEIKQFLEKPAPEEIDTNTISAGIYVLRRDVCDLLPEGEPRSIERDVFPRLVGNGLYGYVADAQAYWMDIGTPDRYLDASLDILAGRVQTAVLDRPELDRERLVLAEDGQSVNGSVSRAVLGAGVTVGAGTTVERAVLLPGAKVGADCVLRDCIVAEGAVVGDRCEIHQEAMIGRGARIGAGNVLGSGCRVFPDAELGDEAIKV
jgi:mannose-1-phosphate guanylyltransferase